MEHNVTTLSSPSGESHAANGTPLQTKSVGVAHVAKGVTVGFKALPSASLPASYSLQDARVSEVDWAGIYPQLSFAQAVAYLPSQFERGHKSARIVKLTAKKPFVVVTCSSPVFMDGSVQSSVKAQLVRDAIRSLGSDTVKIRDDLPLMSACGESEIVLCIPDAEGYELVVPKTLFTQEWLECESLFTFHESASVPAVVGAVEELPRLHRSVLLDWGQLTQTLEQQLAETRCTELEHAVSHSVAS